MTPTPSAPTLRALLAHRDLQLTLASAPSDLAPGALEQPLRWVHSSDLADPTPFLPDDLLLLTTGTQFAGFDTDHDYRAYVSRLSARGVRGLGFGTEVVREGIPVALADACVAERMPLFEVPYRTPFIALAQANAEAIAAQSYERRSWSLAAQRAISLAALRPDGLGATVSELARQLDSWVGLCDPTGTLLRSFPEGALSDGAMEALTMGAGEVLRKGARASATLEAGGQTYSLQTLGRGGHLRGAIVIAGGALDLESRGVVTSVIAMAGLALEQRVELTRAESRLRTGLLHALLEGEASLVRRVSRDVWGDLPPAPVVVAVIEVPVGREEAVAGWLDTHVTRTSRTLFHGRGPTGRIVLVPAADAAVLTECAHLFDAAVGASSPASYARVAAAHDQAVTALRRARPGSVASFAEVAAGSGMRGAMEPVAAKALAEATLQPLLGHDLAHGTALVATVQTWLEHDARIDAAAVALGIHRHTVRARVAQAQALLGVDLASFPARAELWTALQSLPTPA